MRIGIPRKLHDSPFLPAVPNPTVQKDLYSCNNEALEEILYEVLTLMCFIPSPHMQSLKM